MCYNKHIHIQLRQYSSVVFCLSLADVRKTEDFMDKDNNPALENNSGDRSQEEKSTTFTQEQVNDIVSKRLRSIELRYALLILSVKLI
mgnify:CR=1 FL=1